MTKEPLKLLDDEGLTFLTCMQCGTCTGSCPSGRYTSLNTRRIVLSARRNKDVYQDKDLWMCTTCYQCQERCPRGIKIVDGILALRTESVHMGFMLPDHRKVAGLVIEKGHAVPINDANRDKRKKLGMDELPETVHKYPDALDQVKKLLMATGFVQLVKDTEGKEKEGEQ
ncbi:MAG: CoB--CoM heterodisulfide reductase subunit C [Methanosarcinales archaeon]|nr:CoB--CoM heterodisulfide reductase subunit C [ANME-2 cluster archaeon]MDF1532434.1 CoB--CoM heterodisulfide reductase subunit C [ANME-2 cluster archaeon]MDW7776692.1 CoB--CoM heterodisulfide reductase subunit C [Methanosarcinales archaeon]